MDKKLSLKLSGGRRVQGILWGSGPFVNLVIEPVEMAASGPQTNIGTVVIQGKSIMLEASGRVLTVAVPQRSPHTSPKGSSDYGSAEEDEELQRT
ncbi:small nuclear ribonucleoprotein G-like [Peromyscus californicus insignis]|uniref:small nuclear ribonucleoprotein G-like n=1 Tax=Peromyscus californicus insignis TaxID=564181 RepID=UPI0022A77F85|nr:small nuclear ribonucleoprotein G-like [Peromyscus californicus insignis]